MSGNLHKIDTHAGQEHLGTGVMQLLQLSPKTRSLLVERRGQQLLTPFWQPHELRVPQLERGNEVLAIGRRTSEGV